MARQRQIRGDDVGSDSEDIISNIPSSEIIDDSVSSVSPDEIDLPEQENSASSNATENLQIEYNELEQRKQQLLHELEELEGQEQKISNSYGLLATVPGLEVEVMLNYRPEFNPKYSTPVPVVQPKVGIKMNAGDLLNMFPPRNEMEAMPIPIGQMKNMAMIDKYRDRGIVFWDGTKLPEDGGETKEEATKRGLNNFLDYQARLEYALIVQSANIRTFHGENSVPNEAVLRVTEPTTLKMRKLAENVKRIIQLQEQAQAY